jgi:squalene-hopene/tetraprenyl-beta-curcumene cyclase
VLDIGYSTFYTTIVYKNSHLNFLFFMTGVDFIATNELMNFFPTYSKVVDLLLKQRDADGCAWSGQLSSSALGTALAVTALEGGNESDQKIAKSGAQWLVDKINSDGGWGDTPESPSNISTSLIVRACISRHRGCMGAGKALTDSGAWILYITGGLSLSAIASTLRSVYGEDKTFAVPILMYLAICSDDESEWSQVPALPFMLALLPGWCYRLFKMDVVSYALPALIAVGLCRHIRVASVQKKTALGKLFASQFLKKLELLQPEHGGFLDATPLTAFVVLALKNCGYADHPVVDRGSAFLRSSVRRGGCWPIDSNLRIWLTSLSARALAEHLTEIPTEAGRVAEWLISKQQFDIHPFTRAQPGGWAWTDLPGGVPDADDTAAALIALFYLKEFTQIAPLTKTVRLGLSWLMNLQNSNGGMPTFCKGWGKLPFDKSCCDITAHSIEAFTTWMDYIKTCDYVVFDDGFMNHLQSSTLKMVAYLEGEQDREGAWMPLWFGHQQTPEKLNKVIGTARVIKGLHALQESSFNDDSSVKARITSIVDKGESFLLHQQNKDNGWSAGSDSTVEESALVITALFHGGEESRNAARKGGVWLEDMISNNEIKAVPIGLYFSVLWYDEKLYPLIWSLEALSQLKDIE